MFSTESLTILEFGIVTKWPVKVRSFVDRNPMSSTVPSWPPNTIRSPSWNGGSSKMVIDPNSVFSESWAARVTAIPATPNAASHAVMSWLKTDSATYITPTTSSNARRSLRIHGTRCSLKVVRVLATRCKTGSTTDTRLKAYHNTAIE